MSSRTSSVTRRTLHYFWSVTRIQLPMFVLDVAVTLGYVFFLTFASPLIVGQIVDMVGAGGVGPDEVLTAFGPYILALIGVNIAGQVCSKLQDYACAKLLRSARATSWGWPSTPLQPIDDLSYQPLRRLAGKLHAEIHICIQPAYG